MTQYDEKLNQQWLDDDLPIAAGTVDKHVEEEVIRNIPKAKQLHDDFD